MSGTDRNVLHAHHPVGGAGRTELGGDVLDGDRVVPVGADHRDLVADLGLRDAGGVDDRVLGRYHSTGSGARADHVRRTAGGTMSPPGSHCRFRTGSHRRAGGVEATGAGAEEIVAGLAVADVDHRRARSAVSALR